MVRDLKSTPAQTPHTWPLVLVDAKSVPGTWEAFDVVAARFGFAGCATYGTDTPRHHIELRDFQPAQPWPMPSVDLWKLIACPLIGLTIAAA